MVLVETDRLVGPQTVIHELGLLSRALHHAVERHGVRLPHGAPRLSAQRGEGRALKLPKARDRLLSKTEHEALKIACSLEAPDDGKAYAGLRTARRPELWLALVFAGTTSARQSELCNLRWRDVSEESILFRDTKNGSDRLIPIWGDVRQILAQLPTKRPAEARVFGYTPGGLRQAFRRARERAGLENFRFHDLRHCAATELASKLGGDPFLLRQVTGHKTLAAANRYVNDRSRDILAALDKPR
ncbi:site-specific integrase [Hydrocarboniphaga effusa]|uniref:site-specific integrase n=1 Tax=Hydrocarboniphaga effusa TaxID=243629 RepID=UPI003137D87F